MSDNPPPAIFRIPSISVLAVVTLFVCVSPIATYSWWFAWLFAVPALIGLWVWRRRTTVDTSGITIRGLFGSRFIAWADISALRVVGGHRLAAVLTDGSTLPLPEVRVRHLPLLVERGGGRIPTATEPTQ